MHFFLNLISFELNKLLIPCLLNGVMGLSLQNIEW